MNTKTWYHHMVDRLAPILVELQGRGVGNIPLQNLVDVPVNVDKEELATLLRDDGVPSTYWKYTSLPNDDDVIINIM